LSAKKLDILELFKECANKSKQYCLDKVDALTLATYQSITELTDRIKGYLPLAGGTVDGNTIFKKVVYTHHAVGTSATAGYVKIAQIKITNNYQNIPLIFEVVNRNSRFPMHLFLQFNSENNVDPAIGSFTYFGANIGAYIIKSAASTWDLYIKKSEAYDNIGITRYTTNANYMAGVTVTWTDVHANSLPSGCTTATVAAMNIAGTLSTADRDKLDKLAVPSGVNITVPTTGWDSDSSAYPKYYDIAVSGVTNKDRADIIVAQASLDTIEKCGLYSITETLAGKIRIRATSVPTATISMQYWITKGQ